MIGSGSRRSLRYPCFGLQQPVKTDSIGSSRWFLTMHAISRMREMDLERSEVVAALDDPEIRYPARGGRYLACRGALAICFENDTVVTVLWRHEFTREAC